MSYQVLARKWRPANFSQMVGQEHVLQALVNALDSDRLHHAYLFSGTRGVGKTTIARIFAKALNCEQGVSSTPCGECSSCLEVDQGRSVDLLEIDAASRTGVDDMRELLDNVQYAPTRGRFKVYLIDEVHMLSKNSFNALLKTLEEPPEHVKFLLATTDPQKLPVTVLSRCLQFNLKRMSRAQLISQLQFLVKEENIEADAVALGQLAGAADGSMRDALSLLDQAIAYSGGKVAAAAVESMLGAISSHGLLRLLNALVEKNAVNIISEARAIIENGPDYQRVCTDLILLFQQIALYQADPGLLQDEDFDEQDIQRFAEEWSGEEVQLYYQIVLQGRQDLLICPDQAAGFEMLMLRLLAFSPQALPNAPDDELKKKPLTPPIDEIAATTSSAAATIAPPVTNTPPPKLASIDSIAAKVETFEQELNPPSYLDEPDRMSGIEAAASPVVASVTAPVELSRESAVEVIPEPQSDQVDARVLHETENSRKPILPEPSPSAEPASDSTVTKKAPQVVAEFNDHGLGWSELAYQLGLDGLALQIAANSIVVSYQPNKLTLKLVAEIYELSNAQIVDEICQAINQKLGLSLTLDLISGMQQGSETPLQAKCREEEEERIDTIVAIRNEKVVQRLQNAFDVELDESSVMKINE